jgi:hypothetical protein
MIFTVTTSTEAPFSVEGRDWYSVREIMRGRYGSRLLSVVAGGSNPVETIDAWKTATELAYEHCESMREAGAREAYSHVASMLRDAGVPVPVVLAFCEGAADISPRESEAAE